VDASCAISENDMKNNCAPGCFRAQAKAAGLMRRFTQNKIE
jgi:hypothetical protein